MTTNFFLFYVAFQIEGNDKKKVWMKWLFLGMGLLMMVANMILGNIIANDTGIVGLTQFFSTMIWFIGLIFIFYCWFVVTYFAEKAEE